MSTTTTQNIPASVLTKHQTKQFGPKPIAGYGPGAMITVKVRHDDQCGNGHNTFSITAQVETPASKRRNDIEAGGCLHAEVAQYFPHLAPFLKWHLTSTDGPLHYVENTLYWVGKRGWCDGKAGSPPNLAYARSAAVRPDATDKEISNVTEGILLSRRDAMMREFKSAVESLGFTY
jgi:hypothetical protein